MERLKNTEKFANLSHPLANCPIATAAYFKFADVAKTFTKGSEEYEEALLEYQEHLVDCATCREGLDG
jgi:hypothetical protein